MSSALYPQGFNSYNNRLPQGGYKTWKGTGIYSNPIGITSGNMRPKTNLDYRNSAIYKHGLPRPMKHYRKGTSTPIPSNPDNLAEATEANYYTNTNVKTSRTGKLVEQLIDNPGGFVVKENLINNNNTIRRDCQTCEGVGLITNWYPINNLTEKPQDNVMNLLLCCNEQQVV